MGMLDGKKLKLTHHAVCRYHERVSPKAKRKDIKKHLRKSRPARNKLIKRIRRRTSSWAQRYHRRQGQVQFWRSRDRTVFVTSAGECEDTLTIVTCWREPEGGGCSESV